MKKYRIIAAAALVVLPSLFYSSTGYSTSELPAIDPGAGRLGQQNCPVENGSGCSGPCGFIGANPMIAAVFGRVDQFRRERIDSCLQFMRHLRQFDTRSG